MLDKPAASPKRKGLKPFLEAGQIVNTHGTRGEVKIHPWADDPHFLTQFDALYVDDVRFVVQSSRVHKNCTMVKLEQVDTLQAAEALRGKTVYIHRDDANLASGQFFIQDIMGAQVLDQQDNQIGTVKEVLDLPQQIYVVKKTDGTDMLVPNVPVFIPEKNIEKGFIRITPIEGL